MWLWHLVITHTRKQLLAGNSWDWVNAFNYSDFYWSKAPHTQSWFDNKKLSSLKTRLHSCMCVLKDLLHWEVNDLSLKLHNSYLHCYHINFVMVNSTPEGCMIFCNAKTRFCGDKSTDWASFGSLTFFIWFSIFLFPIFDDHNQIS